MPRQTRRSAPAQQTRSASTMAAPRPAAPPRQAPTQQQAPPAQPQHQMAPSHAAPPAVPQPAAPQQPGLFAQMATTAAGVAVGHAAGSAITAGVGSLFGGSSESQPQEQVPPQQQYQQQQQYQAPPPQASACDADAKAFARCLEDSSNDISACQWYLDQLKSCREMAQHY
ncbi:uncharacterized protein BX664DRAFT_343714 [Halteromyces radiatus]|uniref:uncharacterized protein n=1 Tax=Halteromyces radiatus TaxID=101107 RepID=UPI002220B95E|nr:uncharacterized protein BX664DRAFT_343714 [Halteromyces radiatus]KAI8077876.1 hypothetical protein BX664DRAFT_343714 [Halteromyces radiatus]